MSEKRKDNKGRILREGESQRKNGTYQYRYTNIRGERKSVYAPTLTELREKEKAIQRDIDDGIDYSAGNVSVLELVARYLPQKSKVRENTKKTHTFVVNLLERYDMSHRRIKDIKISDAKAFFIRLQNDGYKYSTVATVRGVLRPAFQMAVDDDIIRRNPFEFHIVDVVQNDSAKREALTAEEKKRFLAFLKTTKFREKHYDEVVILLGTGLRVSEMYGLTISDIDFKERRIAVKRQLFRTTCQLSSYYLEKPKTDSGERFVPMSEDVYQAFKRIISNRKSPKTEVMIDGCVGFIFLNQYGRPRIALDLQHALKRIADNYNMYYGTDISITPHVLRHTFCTDMVDAGMDIKSLQYIMGHSDAYTTLNIYAHSNYKSAKESFDKATGSSNLVVL